MAKLKKSILVIGCGSIGERHIRCFQKTGRTEVSAFDLNRELLDAVTARYAVPAVESVESALADPRLDIVLIASPAHTHVPLAIAAARAGKNLLIEKPLSISTDDHDTLLQAITENQCIAAMAYVYRFMPVFKQLKRWLEQNDLGDPKLAVLKGGQPFDEKRPGYEKSYFTRHETGGGVIQDGLTHYTDLLSWFIGPCTSLVADAAHCRLPHVEVEDTVTLLARHGEVLSTIHLNLWQAPSDFTFEIHFDKGSIKAELHRNSWSTHFKGERDWTTRNLPPMERDDPYIAQANGFLDILEVIPAPCASVNAGIRAVQVCKAALQTNQSRQWVDLK